MKFFLWKRFWSFKYTLTFESLFFSFFSFVCVCVILIIFSFMVHSVVTSSISSHQQQQWWRKSQFKLPIAFSIFEFFFLILILPDSSMRVPSAICFFFKLRKIKMDSIEIGYRFFSASYDYFFLAVEFWNG